MPSIQDSYLDEIRSFPWLAKIGETPQADLPFSAHPASDLAAGIESLCALEWENFTLEARNRLTDDLRQRARQRYNQWNEVTQEAKAKLVTPLAEKVWRPKVSDLGVSGLVVDDLQWNVLAAVMEHAYREESRIEPFFKRLLVVYQNGHLPCGWEGGWPAGRLIII